MNDYGLIISKPGFDAEKCAPEDTIFDTRFDTLKAPISDDFDSVGVLNFIFSTVPPLGTTRIHTIKHGLGYKPLYLTYFDYGGSAGAPGSSLFAINQVTGSYFLSFPFSDNDRINLEIRVDEQNMYFDIIRKLPVFGGPSKTDLTGSVVVIKYYIFVNDSVIA